MGENKHIEELDAFAKKYIKEIEVETPSANFTDKLMNVLQQENSLIYKATPLISKKAWFVIFGALIALVLIPFNTSEEKTSLFDKVDLSFFKNLEMPTLFEGANLTASSTTVYACIFLTLMILVQVYMLKNHFAKKFEV